MEARSKYVHVACTFFACLGADLHARSVLSNKISASELSGKFIKSASLLLVGKDVHLSGMPPFNEMHGSKIGEKGGGDPERKGCQERDHCGHFDIGEGGGRWFQTPKWHFCRVFFFHAFLEEEWGFFLEQ